MTPQTASGLDADRIRAYAEAIVRDYVDARPGDTILIDCEPAHRELAEAVAAAAYRLGVALVDVAYQDRRVQAARIREADDAALGVVAPWHRSRLRNALKETTAIVRIVGDEEPGVLAGLDPARMSRDFQTRARTLSWFSRAIVGNRVRWTIVAWPTSEWAARVYPGLGTPAAVLRLGEDILSFARLGADDGDDAWRTHCRHLQDRARLLTDRGFARLEFRGPGTELDVTLFDDTVWLGGGDDTATGRPISPNVPTEEVFTSPNPARTTGSFRCTTPLSFNGRVIEGIAGRFARGRLVEITADDADDRAILEQTFSTDRGAGRLGEVALVDGTSRIGRAGRIYGETLLDENAAAHIALGNGFAGTRAGGGAVNRSVVHLDVMIGSDAVEVTGAADDGSRTAILAGGDWLLAD